MDVDGCESSVYMMKMGAFIPMLGMPFPHDPKTFPIMPDWQLAAALPVIYNFVKEGKVLGPFPGNTGSVQLQVIPYSFILPLLSQSRQREVIDGC